MDSEPLQRVEKNGLPYFIFPNWEETGLVAHGFSTRLGGKSRGRFAELNLGFKGGDDPFFVQENRKRFLSIWGKSEKDLYCGEQVHGTEVRRIEGVNPGKPFGEDISLADALITSEPGVLIGAYSADCLPALFYDPDFPAVGVAHAGWKGTCEGIMHSVVRSMSEAFSTDPQRLQVLTGPSIGSCCYEVGAEVLEIGRRFPWSDLLHFYPGRRPGHPYLDLKRSNYNILQASGVKAENINISQYCTFCRKDLFYSFRGSEGRDTGSLMGIIYLK